MTATPRSLWKWRPQWFLFPRGSPSQSLTETPRPIGRPMRRLRSHGILRLLDAVRPDEVLGHRPTPLTAVPLTKNLPKPVAHDVRIPRPTTGVTLLVPALSIACIVVLN